MVSPHPPMPRRRRPLLLLLLHLLIATAAASQSSTLIQFKLSITSDPGGLLSLWSGPHPCSFPGITCDSTSHIIALNIPCPDPTRRLAGTLSPALASLASLQTLSLPFHNLHGEIPREIWLLKNLSIINLEGNSLSSSLPPHLPIGLTTLNLASNFIHGEIPQSLFSSLKLETLNLSVNQLNGTIPAKLDLPKLRRLSLSFNRIGGTIPDGIGSGCRSLEHLDLSGNLLVGGIPSSLGNCSELESLVLFSNLLGDTIPTDLGRLSKLRVLDVSRNAFSGLVPAELGNCGELSVLVLMNFFDPMPGGDFSIYEGSDEFNCFQGGLPDNITALPKLRVLWAPRAMVEGDIPSNWGSCESLEMVNLGQNLLTGQIPKAFAGCKNLKFLNLSSNQLIGWLDEELPVPCMDVFDVSGNQLTGSIPRFNYGGCSRSPFPADDLALTYYSFFAYKTWTGTSLPYFGPDDDHAVYHNFGRNNLTGSLPALPIEVNRFGNNQTVYAFLADGNHLVGSLNAGLFEKCKDFNGLIFNLSNNMLSGGIPAEIGTLCRSLLVLDVSGNRITGDLPQSFGSRSSLVSLDLSRNGLQGHIPPNLEGLKNLRYLLLASNNLIGQIPDELGHLKSLSVLDLSSNSLTGEIPTGLLNLRNLTVLILSNNKLSGMIPSAFANVTSLSTFNVSFNNLSGPLPSNASMMGCESVIGNPLLQSCYVYALSIPPAYLQGRSGDPQTSSDSSDSSDPPPESPPSNSGSSGFSSIEIASITSAAAIVSVLLALVLLYIYTRKCSPRSSSRPPGRREVIVFVDIGVPITYESVVRATGSFNASNCIGSGGFGATYKAEISPGVLVAIKRLSIGRFQGVQQFHAEIKTLGRCRHVNLVTLIGYHLSEAEMFLIYNYLPGGNLERFIQERSKRAVDWRMLHKIALDVARALTFLHDQCVPRILHRDVKPSNILLDNDYKAYLSDFGLARLLGNSETHVTTGVAGTFGYVAPEYAMTCRVSDKADVYSYGVVLLELISDKKVLDPSFSPYGNGFNIVTWASMMLSQGRAREFFTQGLWDVGPHDDLVEILHLAVTCTDEIVSTRPPMKHVLRRLKELQPPAL